VSGKKVLQIDNRDYYGGESASLNLTQIFEKFKKTKPEDDSLGSDYQYCVDQVPKFLMATGNLIKILIHTKVTHYVNFNVIGGSYVFRGSTQKPCKVPATASDALRSSLMGLFQKRRLRNFLVFVKDCKLDDPTLLTQTASELMVEYKLDENTQSFIGHAMALFSDESYLQGPAKELVKRLHLYAYSLNRCGKSPYIYPMYGLGSISEGFARLSAVYGESKGGALMMDQKMPEILFDDEGKAIGVKSGEKAGSAPFVMGQPRFFPKDKTRVVARVARAICLMDHPIPNTDTQSGMVIIPADQVAKGAAATMFSAAKTKYKARKNDIYVTCVDGTSFEVTAPAKYVAFVSTVMESDNPDTELRPGLDLLGKILHKFVTVDDVYAPTNNSSKDMCHISRGLDASTHFQTVSEDVLKLYRDIVGEDLDMSIDADGVLEEE